MSMLTHDTRQLGELVRLHTVIIRESDGREPELAGVFSSTDVNMWRLPALITIEVKTEALVQKDSWYIPTSVGRKNVGFPSLSFER